MAATIAKVSAGGAKKYYYEKDPIFNQDGGGENLEWSGKQAEVLGLAGMANKKEFSNLLDGKTADGKVQLKEDKNKVAAYDLTFAAPKSVSILALNGDDRLIEAHKKAVEKALNYAEQNFANAKVWKTNTEGKRERVIENQGNLLVAKALHSTNRNQDPHLHTHSLIFNQVFVKEEGKFKALAAQELFKNQKTLDNVYKSELAREVANLGYKIEKTESGGWEIAIKDSLKEEFSSRRAEIMAKAQETGAQTVKEKVHIQHMLKAEKTDITKEELLKNWEQTINKHYGNKEEMFAQAKEEKREQQFNSAKEVLEYTGKLLAENEAVWSKEELLEQATELAFGEFSREDLEKELDNVKKIGQKEGQELKYLGRGFYTNKEMHDLEKQNEKLLKNQKTFEGFMSAEEAKEALASFEKNFFKLNEGQYNTVFNLLTSKDQFQAIQGVAGAGKTTMLKAFNYALSYKDTQADITLLAPTNKAASGAMVESKIGDKAFNAQTVAKHIINIQKQEGTLGKEDQNEQKNETIQKNEQQNIQPKKESQEKFSHEKMEKNEKKDTNWKEKETEKLKKQGLTQAELYVNTGNSVFQEGLKISKSLEANIKNMQVTAIQKGRNYVTKQTKINAGQFRGAIKKEEIKFVGDTVTYKRQIKFRDGSTYNLQVSSLTGGNKLISTFADLKTTKVFNSKGERAREDKLNVLGVNLNHKSVKKQNAKQLKLEANLLGNVAKVSYNKTTFNLKNDLTKTQKAREFGILGFKVKTTTEEIRDKNNNIIAAKSVKEKSFLGFTYKREVEVKDLKDLQKDSYKAQITHTTKIDQNIESIQQNQQKNEKTPSILSDFDKKQTNNKQNTQKSDFREASKNNESIQKNEKEKPEKEQNTQQTQKNQNPQNNESIQKIETTKINAIVDKKTAEKLINDNKKINTQDKMIIIDEASMLSAKDLNMILKDAQKTGKRVVFMGDTKQLQSIGAGRAFEQVQKHTKTSVMDESLRQHTKVDKTIADNARDAYTIVKSFNEIEKNNRVHRYEITDEEKQEIKYKALNKDLKGEALVSEMRIKLKELADKKKEDMLKAAAQAAVKEETLKGTKFGKEYEKTVNYKDNLILANTRAEVAALNDYVRQELKEKGVLKEEETLNAVVVQQKNMSAIKQANAANFVKGQIVQTFHTNQSKMKIGKEYEITGINKVKNTLTLKELNSKDDKTIEVNVKDLAGKFAVQERKEIEIAKNDIIVIIKTDKQQEINNSDRGVVLDIDKENQKIKVDFGDKGVKEIDLSKKNVGLDHGYALTTYKAQGVSVDRVQAIVTKKYGESEKINNLNSFYVAASRQKLKFELFTNGYEKIKQEVKKLQQKTSTLDFKKEEKNNFSHEKKTNDNDKMKDIRALKNKQQQDKVQEKQQEQQPKQEKTNNQKQEQPKQEKEQKQEQEQQQQKNKEV